MATQQPQMKAMNHGVPAADVGIVIQSTTAADEAKYDSFMSGLLGVFPGGNMANSKNYSFSWVRWYGSVLPRVWVTVLGWTLWSVIITLISQLTDNGAGMKAPAADFVGLVGFGTALLLGFRTNSAYERWFEGRKIFENAYQAVREMVRNWTVKHVPKTAEERSAQLAACRCAVAYVYALMYHIRSEDPLQHEDCTALIPRTKNGNLAVESDNPNVKRYYFEQAQNVVQISGIANTGGKKKNLTSFRLPGTWRNPHVYAVPGQICSLLLDYDDKYAGGSEAGRIGALADAQVSLERILATPMPPVYTIHLKMCLTIFFFALPFQYLYWGYWGILLMAITAFVMWGFESMGLELENPFGYDANDLPLSEICATLRREVDYQFEHPIATTEEWQTDVQEVTAEQLDKEIAMENQIEFSETINRKGLLAKKGTETGSLRAASLPPSPQISTGVIGSVNN